jgi:hypothetical protein
VCSLNLQSIKNYECTNKYLFNFKEIDSQHLQYVRSVNKHNVCVLLFINSNEEGIIGIFRLTLTESLDELMFFELSKFYLKTDTKVTKNAIIKGMSFLDDSKELTVTVFMVYYLGNAWIARMVEDFLLEPVSLNFLNKDVFINTQHIMVLDYNKGNIQFYGLLENYNFVREIWPNFKLQSFMSAEDFTVVDDFIAVPLANYPNKFATIVLNDGNPYINKITQIKIQSKILPKYLQTSRMSMVFLGYSSFGEFICLLKSTVIHFFLNLIDHTIRLSTNKKQQKLFDFFLLFKTYFNSSFTHRVRVNLSDDYQIMAKQDYLNIWKFTNGKNINLLNYFKGNIYLFTFMIQESLFSLPEK